MITTILLFVIITTVVGSVNLLLTQPHERNFVREFLSYSLAVMGGIAGFTALIVVLSLLFQ